MLYFGGDYNPDQWPPTVWQQDFALMREAGVNLVTVGVFAWSRLQPAADRFTFDWLDEVMDGLHHNGIGVCLATPTASPPPWFTRLHPEAMPVTREGVRLTHGSRDTYCVNAPAYREASVSIAAQLGKRYAGHPALRMWHVHNEYGTWCFCDHCATAFREWLRHRHGTLDALNDAWQTDFWSQRYGEWEEIDPPRATQYLSNPAQKLDYRRFLSDSFLRHYREQREQLSGGIPDIPVTTNFVLGGWVPVDHARFAREVDLVAIDHYPKDMASAADDRAFAADMARGWARAAGHADGRWLLMEHAPGTVHADGVVQSLPRGSAAKAGETYLERGCAGLMYFQWRASRGGAEQWHPAIVPHEGPSSPIFTEIAKLGRGLAGRSPVTVSADVALVYDEETMWAWQAEHLPTRHVGYESVVRRWHGRLITAHTHVDVVPVSADLSRYRLVVVPALYLMGDLIHGALRAYQGILVITCASGLVDEHARVTPGSLDDLIGCRVVARKLLPPGERIALQDGTFGELWLDQLARGAAEVLVSTADGEPAITKHGNVYYVATMGISWIPD